MVRPIVGERDEREGPRSLAASEELDLIAELGIVDFVQSGRAEFETGLHRGHQFFFPIGFLQRNGSLDFGDISDP